MIRLTRLTRAVLSILTLLPLTHGAIVPVPEHNLMVNTPETDAVPAAGSAQQPPSYITPPTPVPPPSSDENTPSTAPTKTITAQVLSFAADQTIPTPPVSKSAIILSYNLTPYFSIFFPPTTTTTTTTNAALPWRYLTVTLHLTGVAIELPLPSGLSEYVNNGAAFYAAGAELEPRKELGCCSSASPASPSSSRQRIHPQGFLSPPRRGSARAGCAD